MITNPFYYQLQLRDRYPDVSIAFFNIPDIGETVVRMTSQKIKIAQDLIPMVLNEENFEKVIDICDKLYAEVKTADLVNDSNRKESEWVNLGKPTR